VRGPGQVYSFAVSRLRGRSQAWAAGLVVLATTMGLLITGVAGTAAAAPRAGADVRHPGMLTMRAGVDGTALGTATEARPLKLTPGRPATVTVSVDNRTSNPVVIGSVDLEGKVAGLIFFAFDTSVNFDVAPGQARELTYVLDTTSLKGQATGLVPGQVAVLGLNDQTIARQSFVTDVHGSLVSVYGLFGLGILLLTAMAWAEALLALAGGRLPVNRWRRGTRFLAAGLGVGGILVFSLSAAGAWLPSGGHWLIILAIGALAGFVLGYLTPTPVPSGDGSAEDQGQDGDDVAADDGTGLDATAGSVVEVQA
jgi:hypothetical protein